MSKITPKNLSYDSTLPPFLARLQAHNTSNNDRHEFAIARSKKARNPDEEAEDEPVYFDEERGETLTKSEWETREVEKDREKRDENGDGDEKDELRDSENKGKSEGIKEGKRKKDEKIASIGGGKKRKVGKVVGGEDEDELAVTAKKASKQEEKKIEKGKTAKKAKKIKLSFGDEE